MRRYEEEQEAVFRTASSCLELLGPGGRHKRGLTCGNKSAEFCADIEVTARRVLNATELKLFFQMVAHSTWRGCSASLQLNRGSFFDAVYRVEQKLGRAFAEAGMYPPRFYFAGVFLPVRAARLHL
jgi:hypothetical protein